MSRILILYMVMAAFFSCQGNKQKSSKTETPPEPVVEEKAEIKGGTAQDYAESLIVALSTEEVSNFEKLIPAKEDIAESIASELTDEDQKQQALESFNDAAYDAYKQNQVGQFNGCLTTGRSLGVNWPAATFEKLNFVQSTDAKGTPITLGQIRFNDGEGKYIIEIRQGGKIKGLWYASYISTPKTLTTHETE